MMINSNLFKVMIQDLAMKSLSQGVKNQLCTDALAKIFCDGILNGDDAATIAQNLLGMLKPADQTEPNRVAIEGWVQNVIAAQSALVSAELSGPNAKIPADCDISSAGIALIKSYEGFRQKPYNDHTKKEITTFEKVGDGYPTVGYGHKITSAAEFEIYKNGIDATKAAELLQQDLQDAKRKIISKVSVPLQQNQFDALMSLVFNVGNGKTPKLFEKLNAKNYQGAAHEFSDVTKSDNKVLPGLVNRRADEIELFLMGDAKRDYGL